MPGKYTVAEVEARTGIPASSLRQWERRYGFPQPQRASSGYRLYDDDDLQRIAAMRTLIAEGVPASRAAARVREQGRLGGGLRPSANLAAELVEALAGLDETRAELVLSEAFALHTLEDVLLEVITPTMVELGERWHAGELLVSTEHFATNFVQGRLRALLGLMSGKGRQRRVLVGCAPGERHELGALMVALLLRRAGLDAVYLGADTPLLDLAALVRTLRPEAVFLSAARSAAAAELAEHRELLSGFEPVLVVGGRAFDEQRAVLPGAFLGNDLRKVIPVIVGRLDDRAAARR